MLLRCGHDDDDDEDDEQPNTIAAVVPSFLFFVFLPPATGLIPLSLSLSLSPLPGPRPPWSCPSTRVRGKTRQRSNAPCRDYS